jgi:two-component system phosphate regulon sensor histidine kinase PhoR
MIRSLRYRWLLYYVFLILLTTLVLDTVLHRSLRNYTVKASIRELQTNLNLIRYHWEAHPHPEGIDPFAKEVSKAIKMRVTIIGINGQVLGDSDVPAEQVSSLENHLQRPEVQAALQGKTGESIRHSKTLKTDMVYVAQPFIIEGKPAGVIRLAYPLYHVDQLLIEIRRILYGASFLALLIAMAVGYYLANRSTKPIREMTLTANQIAREEFHHKVRVNTHDELEDLAESLNIMSSKLESRFREIQEEKQQLTTILASMAEGVMVLDSKGKILLTNKAFMNIFRLHEDPVGHTPIEIIRNPEVAKSLMEGLHSENLVSREITLSVPGNKIIRFLAAPLLKGDVRIGLVTVFHDITDIRVMEQVRKDFVANVSHELRTPLTTVQGFAETLLDGALEDKEVASRFIRNIYTQTRRMTALVQDLLCLAQIESGKIQMKFELADLRAVIKSSKEALEEKSLRQNVPVLLELPPDPVVFPLDIKYFSQALINLLDNAIKFSSPGSQILLQLLLFPHGLEIRVNDKGCGIPAEDLPRIFERFYRVDKSRSAETEGTGLGLSIVKHIIESHHGTVSVESDFGEGTTFILHFEKPFGPVA